MIRIHLDRKDALKVLTDAGFPPSIAENQIIKAVDNAGDWCIKWAGNTKTGILYEYSGTCEGFRVLVEPDVLYPSREGLGVARG